MSEKKATPTPWQAHKGLVSAPPRSKNILDDTGVTFRRVCVSEPSCYMTEEECAANAEFIALACNAHAGLVARITELERGLRGALSAMENARAFGSQGNTDLGLSVGYIMDQAVAAALAALAALANGTGEPVALELPAILRARLMAVVDEEKPANGKKASAR